MSLKLSTASTVSGVGPELQAIATCFIVAFQPLGSNLTKRIKSKRSDSDSSPRFVITNLKNIISFDFVRFVTDQFYTLGAYPLSLVSPLSLFDVSETSYEVLPIFIQLSIIPETGLFRCKF